MKAVDRAGQRFGRLLVLERAGSDKFGNALWKCACDCGGDIVTEGNRLRLGKTQSCGCLHRERLIEASISHGMSKTREYANWQRMIARCHRPTSTQYGWYGSRGIVVCERWRESFEAFLADIGPRPSRRHTLDRIDNDGNYEPGNTRWATKREQALNSRPAKRANARRAQARGLREQGIDLREIARALGVSLSSASVLSRSR